jgi:actin-related protein 6
MTARHRSLHPPSCLPSCSTTARPPSRRASSATTQNRGMLLPTPPHAFSPVHRVISNAIVRSKGDKATYFGHEITQCRDYSSLHYRLPFEKVCSEIHFPHLRLIRPGPLGISGRLGRAEGDMGRYLFGPSPWGKSFASIASFPLLKTAEQVDTTQSSLLITEPYFNLPNIQDTYDQLIFEEYEFSSYYRCTRK